MSAVERCPVFSVVSDYSSTQVCRLAARNGDISMLEWAVAHGAPWDAVTLSGASHLGRRHVVLWAMERGLELGNVVAWQLWADEAPWERLRLEMHLLWRDLLAKSKKRTWRPLLRILALVAMVAVSALLLWKRVLR
jgi:hypothetical protein